MRHPIHYRGGVRGYGRRGEGSPLRERVFVLLMPSLGSTSIGVSEDNKGAINLAENPLSSSNSKHIDVRYQFLRKLVGTGDLSVECLRTEDQHADILTKAMLAKRASRNTAIFFKDTVICCSSLVFV